MAFTATEIQQIRTVLGYAGTLVAANTWLNTSIGQTTAEDEVAIRALLGKLTTIDTAIENATAQNLTLKTVEGGIEFLGPEQIEALKREGSRLANRVGVVLGIQVREDIYQGSAAGAPACR
jgi:hypothetical protein